MKTTTIRISEELKSILDSVKIIPRETYEEVIFRLVEPLLELSEETLKECKKAESEKKVGFDEVIRCMK